MLIIVGLNRTEQNNYLFFDETKLIAPYFRFRTMPWRRMEDGSYSFLPRQLYLEERVSGTHYIRGWVGNRSCPNFVMKRQICSAFIRTLILVVEHNRTIHKSKHETKEPLEYRDLWIRNKLTYSENDAIIINELPTKTQKPKLEDKMREDFKDFSHLRWNVCNKRKNVFSQNVLL
jgi:uncharacterized protein with HEPN domain